MPRGAGAASPWSCAGTKATTTATTSARRSSRITFAITPPPFSGAEAATTPLPPAGRQEREDPDDHALRFRDFGKLLQNQAPLEHPGGRLRQGGGRLRPQGRSEERRVGEECLRPCRSRRSQEH